MEAAQVVVAVEVLQTTGKQGRTVRHEAHTISYTNEKVG